MGTRDLIRDFQEQWRFMHVSMRGFDAGEQFEAKRIATVIRTFVHDTGASTSLLKQLDVKDRLWFMASGGGVDPANQSGTMSLTAMQFAAAPSMSSFTYLPHAQKDMFEMYENEQWDWIRRAAFRDWWEECAVIKDVNGHTYTRRDLVLMLANRDGGAHIDNLLIKEAALKNGLNYGWALELGDDVVHHPGVPLSPVEASVRTIANELDLSFLNQPHVLGFGYEGPHYIEPERKWDGDPEAAVAEVRSIKISHTEEGEEEPDWAL